MRDNVTGNALKRARSFLSFTQEEMATFLGVSIATYQRREALAEEHIPKAEAFMVEARLGESRRTAWAE